jgi:hypothetical protein
VLSAPAGGHRCRLAHSEGTTTMPFIDVFSWIVLAVSVATLVAVFVALGMMPGRVARKRGHPWAEAVTVGSWATLIFGLVFWPLILIWAYVDVPARPEAPR